MKLNAGVKKRLKISKKRNFSDEEYTVTSICICEQETFSVWAWYFIGVLCNTSSLLFTNLDDATVD